MIGASASFETKTSLSFQVDIGLKNYLTKANFSDSITTRFDNNNKGLETRVEVEPGWLRHINYQELLRLLESRMQNKTTIPVVVYDNPSASYLTATLSVGQSIFENTGLNITCSRKWLLDNMGRAYVSGTTDYFTEDELTDDPYSYTSTMLSATLSQLLPWDIKLQGSGFYDMKDYVYPANLALGTGPPRKDDYIGAAFAFEKTFEWEGLLSELGFTLTYYYIENRSNVRVFNYFNNSLSLLITASF
jgi:hypothetical protein